MTDALNRRSFLKWIGLTGAAGTVGCQAPAQRELISLVLPEEQRLPGVASWYSTTCGECPAGCGMKVRVVDGRATKAEGNPAHPVNQGGLCVRGQAGVQGLYNPDRIQRPFRRREDGTVEPIGWEEAEAQIAERLSALATAAQRNRIAFLAGHNGETLDHLIRHWMSVAQSERYFLCEPLAQRAIREGSRIVFGKPAVPAYHFEAADYLISFGADYLETWLSPVCFSRSFARLRQRRPEQIGKIVHVEPRLSLTGANADEWIAVRPGTEMFLALAMTRHIMARGLGVPLPAAEARGLQALLQEVSIEEASRLTDTPAATIARLAEEFAAAPVGVALGGGAAGSGVNATATQAAVHLLNHVAGRIGQTVRFDRPYLPPETASIGELRELVAAMEGGEIEILFLHGANPVFQLPPALGMASALRKVPLVVSFSSFPDESTELAHLVLPDHTPLEQWGDHRPMAGVHSLRQPVMNPLFETQATGDVLLRLARRIGGKMAAAFPEETFQEYLKDRWRKIYASRAGEDFEVFWREALGRGGVWEPPGETETAAVRPRSNALSLSPSVFAFRFPPPAAQEPEQYFLHVYPSSRYYDGRGANRPWLHEIPDPITNVVWDSWVEVHPELARKLGVVKGDLLRVESPAGQLEAPVYLYEGVRPDTIAIPLGLGHSSYGRYARGVGVNPVALLPAGEDPHSGDMAWAGVTVRIAKTGRRSPLVTTDGSLTDHGRGFSRIIPLSALTAPAPSENRFSGTAAGEELPSLYPPHEHPDYRWGMAINLSACTGCGACVAACYAENNIPVVGKERIAEGRHMAWIRVERYIERVSSTPDIRFSPMMCQQCDNAPCEPVCPVYATMHNSDGLNVQVYNRCVGTRYCSNNCPYKVRTFNWFDYSFPEPLPWQFNPDVSLRSKGIMEKCTFCIHRIRQAKDAAKDEGRMVRDGEVLPACVQSCPAQAMVFGNLKDADSAVSRIASRRDGYRVLEELNTRPAITYLPRIKRA